jgi:peptidoglycan hydrolase-like protein with peptidoglycan-binding domain
MPVTLAKPFARDIEVDEFDTHRMKKTLNRLGYYLPPGKLGITGIPDAAIFDALKKFQKDRGLAATGAAKPDDATIKTLNGALESAPDGYYIWHTVGDDKVRAKHDQLDGTIRAWSDAPDPGQDHNCRCWAVPIDLNDDPDAISPVISPFDLLIGGLFIKGGIRITLATFRVLKSIMGRSTEINLLQEKSLARFIKKVPVNSKNNIQLVKFNNGNVKFTAVSPGKIQGSRAIYEKTVDKLGRTIKYTKTTYNKDGQVVHVKNKLKAGVSHDTK